jgi:hypothetical protein
MVALLTDEAWLTMPPLPHTYQGRNAIGAFLRGAEERRGAPMRLVSTRANTQPAFGCYLSVSVGPVRTCRVPPGPRMSMVSLGPPAIGGRSGDSIFWLANSPPRA